LANLLPLLSILSVSPTPDGGMKWKGMNKFWQDFHRACSAPARLYRPPVWPGTIADLEHDSHDEPEGDTSMATFISTIKFTEQGIKSIGETTKRAASLKASAKKMGVKVTSVLWTLGAYDGLLIFEAPDDETATVLMLHLCSMGNLQTTTARAFTTAEMDGILAKMTG
jgi:uncharacterized protein with GYD domain